MTDHFRDIVLPAIREYYESENNLTTAISGQSDDLEAVRLEALRRARTAVIELNHLSDDYSHTNNEPLSELREKLFSHCTMMRSGQPYNDFTLIRDIADAFKHTEISRSSASVKHKKAVISTSTGYGELGYGEGKWGGVEQVVVKFPDEKSRALTSIIQNVVDAWRRVLGTELPPISEF
ncbi:MAG: hypothetical protein AAFW83_01745 [Pseudomonadota bacterium]